ncbi:MmcQ/YjbR family DNA-binding protein [Chloroflexia bacterium SDU3-3]|nr:MmcQ/YjbR family DNA-binding protein [Chloroflexia bacterium SDU3-3]
MTLQDQWVRTYLQSKIGSAETFPFGPDPVVAKVGGKIFALLSCTQQPQQLSLKCDPIDAQLLRDTFPAVIPGYHLNKRHWNTIILDDSVPDHELRMMIDQSYRLVVAALPRAERAKLALP